MPISCAQAIFWWKLAFVSSFELEESFFWNLDCLGINRGAVQYSPAMLNQRTFLVWLPSSEWPEVERKRLLDSFMSLAKGCDLVILNFSWERIQEEDWSKSWKKHWKPDPIGENFLVLPAWLELPEEHSHRLILRLDPGASFGTGSHPTTRLCLEALEKAPPIDLIVADIGCGSGILSLGALGLGAKEVWAIDIDSLAVKSSAANIRLNNGFSGIFSVFPGSLDVLKAELKGKEVDLLVCNILAPVIEELAPSFDELIALGGRALLSGLLVDQIPRLVKIFDALGWKVATPVEKDNWCLLEIFRSNTKKRSIRSTHLSV